MLPGLQITTNFGEWHKCARVSLKNMIMYHHYTYKNHSDTENIKSWLITLLFKVSVSKPTTWAVLDDKKGLFFVLDALSTEKASSKCCFFTVQLQPAGPGVEPVHLRSWAHFSNLHCAPANARYTVLLPLGSHADPCSLPSQNKTWTVSRTHLSWRYNYRTVKSGSGLKFWIRKNTQSGWGGHLLL